MAWEEVKAANNDDTQEDREFLAVKIGSEFEGTVVWVSSQRPSKYGGVLRYISLDLTDGRKVIVTAAKILLERVEAAGLTEGDQIKVVVGSATSKSGREYALPRLYVDRSSNVGAPSAAPEPAHPSIDDEPPF